MATNKLPKMDAQQNNQQFQLENVFNVKSKGIFEAQHTVKKDADPSVALTSLLDELLNGFFRSHVRHNRDDLAWDILAIQFSYPVELLACPAGDVYFGTIDCQGLGGHEADTRATTSESKEKSLHILINNAGISSPTANTDADNPKKLQQELFQHPSSTFDKWEHVFHANVTQLFFSTTTFLCGRRLLPWTTAGPAPSSTSPPSLALSKPLSTTLPTTLARLWLCL